MTSSKGAVVRRITVAAAAAAALVAPVVATAPAADAAGTVVSAVSLSAPRAAQYGSPITLTGTVWRYGTQVKIPGATIVLQRSAHGANRWANLKSTRSAANGTFSFSVTQGLAYDYRAYYGGSAVYRPNLSPVRYPIVIQKLFLDGMRTVDPDRGILRAVGRVYPTPPKGSVVYLQRYDAASKTYKSFTYTRTNGSSTVVIDARVGASTGWYRLYAPARGAYGAGASVGKVFTHYVWRGAFKRALLGQGGTEGGRFEVITDPQAQKSVAVTTSDPGGSAWGDVNTAGCIRVGSVGLNFQTEGARLELLNGSTPLRSVVIPNAVGDEPGETSYSEVAISGLTKVRGKVTDLGGSQPLDAAVFLFLLCNN